MKDRSQLFRQVFAFCWTHWRRQPLAIAAMAASIGIATALDAAIPLLFGRLVDAISGGDRPGAVRDVLAVVAAGAVLAVFRFATFGFLIRSSLRVMKDIVEEAFHRVQRFSTDWHASSFAGATVRYITRGVWAYDSLADTIILGLFPSVVVLLTAVGALAWHWAAMGTLVAVGVALYLAVAIGLTLYFIAPAAQRSNALDSQMSGALADAVTCNPVVKAFAAEAREDRRLAEIAGRWQALVRVTWIRHTIAGASQSGIALLLQAGILALGVWLWAEGRATPGDVAYVLTTFTVIQGYLRDSANHVRTLQRAVNDMEDVSRFSHLPLGIEDAAGARPLKVGAGEIAFERVTFRYPGKSEAIYRDFSLVIRPGEKIGLVGASGSGKSTFVKLIQRFYDLQAGRIVIDGQDIAQVTQASLRAALSVVPQDPVLFHRSLADNIAYGKPGAGRDEVAAAARRAHADEFIRRLPEGYASLVGERGVKLSGGERQRIALARAVLSDAALLVFDEATSSLDSVSEHLLQEALDQVTAGRTTIIIAHRLSTVQRVDRILVFDAGTIVEQGTHGELLAKPGGHYRRLFDTQVLGLTGDAAE